MCEEDGEVSREVMFKIGDFGLSTSVSASGGKSMAGTLLYMAPEALARGRYSANIDVFSLGITLAEVVFVALCRWALLACEHYPKCLIEREFTPKTTCTRTRLANLLFLLMLTGMRATWWNPTVLQAQCMLMSGAPTCWHSF